MTKKERTFTEDEYYLLGEMFHRCHLSLWFDWDDYMANPERVMDKIGQALVPDKIKAGMEPRAHHQLISLGLFDAEWKSLLQSLKDKETENNHPLLAKDIPRKDAPEVNVARGVEEALFFVLDLASRSGVPEHVARFVNPSLIPQFTKEQAAFAKVKSVIDNLQLLRARSKALPESEDTFHTTPEPVIF